MGKEPGLQTFNKNKDYKHIFKSDKLKVVSDKGVTYEDGFNEAKGNQILAICKYTKLSNLEKSVNESNFYFGSPYEWLDPFELLFYKPKMLVNQEKNEITIHACCFACNDIDNEEGFWQIWSIDEKEPIVRITYNVEKLLSSLNRQSKNKYDFYLAGMEYETREKILNLHHKNHFNSYDTINDYLNMLCLKRNAYRYENELRLFVKSIGSDNQSKNTVIENIDYSDGIITEITLPPAKPLGNSNPDKDKMKKYQDCINSLTFQRLQRLIDSRKLQCDINQSALYCTNVNTRTYKL